MQTEGWEVGGCGEVPSLLKPPWERLVLRRESRLDCSRKAQKRKGLQTVFVKHGAESPVPTPQLQSFK